MMTVEMEIQIEPGREIKVTGTIRDVFEVIRSLKEEKHKPLVRYFDQELDDYTCWQPTGV